MKYLSLSVQQYVQKTHTALNEQEGIFLRVLLPMPFWISQTRGCAVEGMFSVDGAVGVASAHSRGGRGLIKCGNKSVVKSLGTVYWINFMNERESIFLECGRFQLRYE